ncbi:MAG: hypothetical protein F9K23_06355 [Bacteroidetes bacterium]|nr:MAG: hypothetical protein F9K23_06355 [Bacteroidota bacterium]
MNRTKTFYLLIFSLFTVCCMGQAAYNGPYLEALVKYNYSNGGQNETPGWGLGFRIDTVGRRYVVIANDGWLTKSEFFYDSITGHVTREVSLQLATGVRHIYNYLYGWEGDDTLISHRSDYGLTTTYIYQNKLLQSVEKVYLGTVCKIVNQKPAEKGVELPENTTCFERVTFYRDPAGNITGRRFAYYYSQFNALPEREYTENYHRNAQGLIDTVFIGNAGKRIVMAFDYDKKGRMLQANRKHENVEKYETWAMKYKCNGLLKKVTYRDYPVKEWVDKYRWKKYRWKKEYPIIPHLSNFISSYELKLAEDFYFGY